MSIVLGLDLGGTVVKAGLADETGRVILATERPSAEREGLRPWLDAALDAAGELLGASVGEPRALGLSVPGAVDPSRRVLVDLVSRLPDAGGLDLSEAFGKLGLPVAADNDARAALEAERRWGAARGVDDVVLLTIGTGIGGAALVGGRPPGGDPVLAGNQLGHLTIELDGEPCVCGNRGCAERYGSASALVRAARAAGMDAADARAVFDAAVAGDEPARRAVTRFGRALAATIVNAIHAYQPDLVLLGGGVMGSSPAFLPDVVELVQRRAWTLPRRRVRVELCALEDRLGVLAGAAVAFRDHVA